MFPPNGARLELANDEAGKPDPMVLKVAGGAGPLTVLVNGVPSPQPRGAAHAVLSTGWSRLRAAHGHGCPWRNRQRHGAPAVTRAFTGRVPNPPSTFGEPRRCSARVSYCYCPASNGACHRHDSHGSPAEAQIGAEPASRRSSISPWRRMRVPPWSAGRCVVGFPPGIFSIPPIDRDEARFAQATKQMVETGDYIDIRFQDEVRYKKPVGIYWLQAAVVKAASALGVRRRLRPSGSIASRPCSAPSAQCC